MKTKILILSATMAILAGALLLLHGCQKTAREEIELTIIFSCDTQGRLEPCGCFTGQYGGISRFYSKRLALLTENTLCVDVGDSIAGEEDYNVIQYHYILQAYKMMDYDAVNIGKREARLNLQQLDEIKKNTPVPIISANLLREDTQQAVFPSYRVVQRGAYTIALVGVFDAQGMAEELGEGLATKNMELAIAEVLPSVKHADMCILLAFASEEKLRQLANEFYEFDVVLGGEVAQPAQRLIRENRSVISYTTNQARTLAMMRGRIGDTSAFTLNKHDIFLLYDTIPEEPRIIDLARQYREKIRKTPLAIDQAGGNPEQIVAGVRPSMSYVGSDVCASCHQSSSSIWHKTGHAHAFISLKHRDSEADPRCLKCHTVGFGEFSGYRREFQDRKLIDVGCESCHGPGSEHVRQRKSGEVLFRYRPIGEGDCRRCHYGEFSRPFVWEKFWPLVEHGK